MSAPITVAAIGDVAPLWPVPSSAAWDPLRYADLAMANLELPLTRNSAGGTKTFTLRADPDVAPSLRDCGIDLVSIANNHASDYGTEGLLDTVSALDGVGIRSVGGGRDLGEACAPVIQDRGGVRVATLGLASTLPPGFAAGRGQPGIAPVHVETRFFQDHATLAEQPGAAPWVETRVPDAELLRVSRLVAEARTQADVVVVQIHWGIPNGWSGDFQGPLAEYQRPLGHALIDAGADLVLGHHPHFVHGLERYRSGLIAYSLSHFLFHAIGNRAELEQGTGYPPYDMSSVSRGTARETVVLLAEVRPTGVGAVRCLPARLDEAGEPVLDRDRRGQPVLDRLVEASSRLDTALHVENGQVEVA